MIIDGKDSKPKAQSKSRPSSPRRSRTSKFTPPSASLVDGEFAVTEREGSPAITGLFEDLQISQDSSPNPRSFPYSVKQQCWEKAEKVKGRDPTRWRRDAVRNIVFRKLVGCPGCLCHDYDHIIPYSKGGKSTLENCQVLQATVNRSKGNRTELSKADLIQRSSYCRVSGRDMDLIELSAYGNVHHGEDSGGCRIQ
ncbi:HNH endonuclease isoform 2 [Hibiscus syriacus]|uniref:HNH endonuclease isoform 2 n=1 Tax=Hibiscus syriacus TaxID=106335 RepID=A0A6A2XI46_HIBSY|nr:HNH endonuclease isoform 2 [Hibiscus syriacus]